MPELPEVTTTVRGLQKVLPGLVITSIWTDLAKKNQTIKQFKETIKDEAFFRKMQKKALGAKVVNVERRAKNVLINLSNGQTILIHMKMTGHIIYGAYVYNKKENTWIPSPDEREALRDPFNRFIHVVFSLSNKKQFVLCDARKFGKVVMLPTDDIHKSIHLKDIGPEPLKKDFSFEKFRDRLGVISKRSGKNIIKTTLMDQSVIAGIGNIYSDEMLWLASIHPQSNIKNIPGTFLQKLYVAMKEVLGKGINFGGDSTSDYRDIHGMPGAFQHHHNVYRKKGERCGKRGCPGVILRYVIGGRSAHFCSTHQKLF
jgi:formamidopyrimidine-DNA glycosylase